LATFKTSDGGQINLHNVSIDVTFQEKYEAAVESRLIGSLEPYYRGLIKRGDQRISNKKSLSEIKRKGNIKFIE
jgi:hypothetical protein